MGRPRRAYIADLVEPIKAFRIAPYFAEVIRSSSIAVFIPSINLHEY